MSEYYDMLEKLSDTCERAQAIQSVVINLRQNIQVNFIKGMEKLRRALKVLDFEIADKEMDRLIADGVARRMQDGA